MHSLFHLIPFKNSVLEASPHICCSLYPFRDVKTDAFNATEKLMTVWQMTTDMLHLSLSQIMSFPHSCFINGCVTRVTHRVSLVEQELLTILEHMSSRTVLVRTGQRSWGLINVLFTCSKTVKCILKSTRYGDIYRNVWVFVN